MGTSITVYKKNGNNKRRREVYLLLLLSIQKVTNNSHINVCTYLSCHIHNWCEGVDINEAQYDCCSLSFRCVKKLKYLYLFKKKNTRKFKVKTKTALYELWKGTKSYQDFSLSFELQKNNSIKKVPLQSWIIIAQESINWL